MLRTDQSDDEVKTLADACFAYLISDPEQLSHFMGLTGMDSDSLRKSIGSESLSAGLLDYFAQNEPALLAMCANAGLSTDRFMRSWQRLNPSE